MRLGVSAALVEGEWVPGDVAVADGRVEAVGLSPGVGRRVVAAGFVDHQVNGFAGVDLRGADADGYATVTTALARHGVTRFLPTFHSTSVEGYRAALATLAEVHRRPPAGAHIGGAHLEGPFLSRVWAGAHDPQHLLDPELGLVDELLAAGPVELVTLAPELPGAIGVVRRLVDRGVRVSVGHTDATAEECRAAFDAGADMLTHCFNAHRRFTGRDPGPAAAALVDHRVRVGLIADGHHVADDAVRLVAAAAGDRLLLVSDAVAPAGSEAVEWGGGASRITITGGRAELADGTLAGSVMPLDAVVRRLVGLGLEPATVLRAAGGDRLRVGAPADVVVLDEAWTVVDTFVAGRRVDS